MRSGVRNGVGLRYRTVSVPVMAGLPATMLAAPSISSNVSAMTPPWTQVGGPS